MNLFKKKKKKKKKTLSQLFESRGREKKREGKRKEQRNEVKRETCIRVLSLKQTDDVSCAHVCLERKEASS